MAKDRADSVKEEEEQPAGFESSRSKEGKFVAERSETGTVAEEATAAAGGGAGSTASASGSKSGDSKASADDKTSSRRGGRGGRYRIPSDFCRDFIFFECKRRDCKYQHPSTDSQEYKDARATRSVTSTTRDRSRSPLHSGRSHHDRSSNRNDERSDDESGSSTTLCRDFLRNMCYRGKDCRFAHPPDGETEDLPWPQLCLDYRAGSCKRFDCRFLHYSLEDEDHYMRTGTVRKELWQHFVAITLRDSKILKNRPICKVFLQNGHCSMNVCRYRHLSQKEYDDEIYQVLVQMVYEKCRRSSRDLPPPPVSGDMISRPSADPIPPPRELDLYSAPPPPPQVGFSRNYDHMEVPQVVPPRREYEWEQRGPYGFPKQPDPNTSMECEQLNRENIELRRMMSEDTARYKADVERLNMENVKLQEELNYSKSNASTGAGPVQQQMSMLKQENEDMTTKMKSINDWSVELQAKFSTARRECDELRDSVKVLNLELATVNDEKIKLKRKSDELEAKLQVANNNQEQSTGAVEKKEYLETKFKQYYEGMKRCETEFASILEKEFSITTPQVMSYFPSWGALMAYITEIVTQINSTSQQHLFQGTSYGGYGSAGAYSMPPPTSTTAYSGYQQQQQQYGNGSAYAPPQQQSYSNTANYYGAYGGDSSTAAGYGTSGASTIAATTIAAAPVVDKRMGSKAMTKDAMPQPWKNRN